MVYKAKTYGQLLAEAAPGVIGSAEEYERTEAIFNRLMDKGEDNLSPDESRLFELLAKLLEDYESRTLPPLADVSPADALRFLMEENDLRQSDLDDIFGSQTVVSKILHGKRSITKEQAKGLAKRFGVSVELFI